MKGLLVEARFRSLAIHKGWIVSAPTGSKAPYDFLVDTGEEILKVQCKHLTYYNEGYRLQTHSKVGRKGMQRKPYHGRVDYMFGHNIENDVDIWVHIDECPKCEMLFRDKAKDARTNLLSSYLFL